MYFTLKDENSLIKCIMFKTSTSTLKFVPKDGMKVIVFGTVSVFERDGIYQIYCKKMLEDGNSIVLANSIVDYFKNEDFYQNILIKKIMVLD